MKTDLYEPTRRMLAAAPPEGWTTQALAWHLGMTDRAAARHCRKAGAWVLKEMNATRWFGAEPTDKGPAREAILASYLKRSLAGPTLRDVIREKLHAADPLLGLANTVALRKELGCSTSGLRMNLLALGAKSIVFGLRARWFVTLPDDPEPAIASMRTGYSAMLKGVRHVPPVDQARKTLAEDRAKRRKVAAAARPGREQIRPSPAKPAATPLPRAVEVVVPAGVKVTVLPGAERWDHRYQQGAEHAPRYFRDFKDMELRA